MKLFFDSERKTLTYDGVVYVAKETNLNYFGDWFEFGNATVVAQKTVIGIILRLYVDNIYIETIKNCEQSLKFDVLIEFKHEARFDLKGLIWFFVAAALLTASILAFHFYNS